MAKSLPLSNWRNLIFALELLQINFHIDNSGDFILMAYIFYFFDKFSCNFLLLLKSVDWSVPNHSQSCVSRSFEIDISALFSKSQTCHFKSTLCKLWQRQSISSTLAVCLNVHHTRYRRYWCTAHTDRLAAAVYAFRFIFQLKYNIFWKFHWQPIRTWIIIERAGIQIVHQTLFKPTFLAILRYELSM